MPIPKNIEEKHILQAIFHIQKYGTPEEREATKFHMNYDGKLYSPKYVLSIANLYANDEELSPELFSGGEETNNYLKKLGFKIEKFGVSSHSWTIQSNEVAFKVIDKSVFLHNGTGLPKEIRSFFDIVHFKEGQKQNITLIYNEKQYDATIEFDKMDNPRSKMRWSGHLSNAIRLDYPNEYGQYKAKGESQSKLKMKFIKYNNNEYQIAITENFSFNGEAILDGRFENALFQDSFRKREYVKGKDTKYYIITVNYPTLVYEVYVLENHNKVATDTVIDRESKNLLTPAKQTGIRLLLEYNSNANINNTTMVHFKFDRPNGKPWEKDSITVLRELFNEYHNELQKETELEKALIKEIDELIEEVDSSTEITESEKEQVIKARIGHSQFKKSLLNREKKCKLCGVTDERFLVASHIKPWSKSNNQERLDVNNGLLLCPNHDYLFDKGYISFDDDGRILISSTLGGPTKTFMNLYEDMRIQFDLHQLEFIRWHRENLYEEQLSNIEL
ncbi:HNH endonuclease [Sediminibacillus albus]|uniref:HNH endonuclease n=1 Tax=Sediminibacillus albus TaxID=407036 RepID=A0A1G8X8U0_9BACI|nr:HNH endonuclease [Sediminibacillus albus]SDJ86160.1 HNH endonuclease [Sediminibacillus albus]